MKAKIFLLMLVGFFFILVFSSLINGSVCTGTFSCNVFGSQSTCEASSGCNWARLSGCTGDTSCYPYTSQSICEASSGCSWDVISFDSRDNVNDYLEVKWETGGQQPPTQTCSDDSDCSQGQVCTNGVCVTSTPPIIPNFCSQYTICSDATTKAKCGEADLCQVSSLDGCLWNDLTSSCNPYETIISEQGEEVACSYEEQITSTCETSNFLEYSLSLIEGSSEDCETKEPRSIICSAKTKLPLESKFGILLTILVIVLGYLFFRGNKKRKNL